MDLATFHLTPGAQWRARNKAGRSGASDTEAALNTTPWYEQGAMSSIDPTTPSPEIPVEAADTKWIPTAPAVDALVDLLIALA